MKTKIEKRMFASAGSGSIQNQGSFMTGGLGGEIGHPWFATPTLVSSPLVEKTLRMPYLKRTLSDV